MWDTEGGIEFEVAAPVSPEDTKSRTRINQIMDAVDDLYGGTHLSKNEIAEHPKVVGSKGEILKTIDEMVEAGMLLNSSETVRARIHPNTQWKWG